MHLEHGFISSHFSCRRDQRVLVSLDESHLIQHPTDKQRERERERERENQGGFEKVPTFEILQPSQATLTLSGIFLSPGPCILVEVSSWN